MIMYMCFRNNILEIFEYFFLFLFIFYFYVVLEYSLGIF